MYTFKFIRKTLFKNYEYLFKFVYDFNLGILYIINVYKVLYG